MSQVAERRSHLRTDQLKIPPNITESYRDVTSTTCEVWRWSGTPASLLGAWQVCPSQNYFIAPLGMGMSELKMSHWVTHFPSTFFEASIHLPWSTWEPSAPVTTYVPVP